MFIGVDLSWKALPKRTAVVALDSNKRVIIAELITHDEELIAILKNFERCVVAIDSPLIVKNKKGRRKCDALLQEKYGIPCYPANLSWFNKAFGGVRGEKIVKKLEKIGFKLSFYFPKENKRIIIEVYPYASWKMLLKDVPKYKKGRKHEQKAAMKKLHEALKAHGILLPKEEENHDILDATIAAYTAYYFYNFPEKCDVLGDLEEGFIVVPIKENQGKRKGKNS